jgi:large subunit ribosomal protein L29
MKADEMRGLPESELIIEIEKTRQKLWKLRFRPKGEPLEKPSEIRVLRRDIARMMTLLREKQKLGALSVSGASVSGASSSVTSSSGTPGSPSRAVLSGASPSGPRGNS